MMGFSSLVYRYHMFGFFSLPPFINKGRESNKINLFV
jgi:hypothetical protein